MDGRLTIFRYPPKRSTFTVYLSSIVTRSLVLSDQRWQTFKDLWNFSNTNASYQTIRSEHHCYLFHLAWLDHGLYRYESRTGPLFCFASTNA